ncbi:MAG: hypothetical protein ACI9EF_002901 [Pseudohongiellaceae bacterium]|jgi:hypothetical protein
METVCPATAEAEAQCEATRWALCGLAVGQTLGRRGVELAAHVAQCPSCDAYVDELAEVRKSLGVDGGAIRPNHLEPMQLRERALAALARELEARLARDLLAMAGDDQLRELESRRRDLARLQEMRGVSRVPDDVWAEVRHAMLGDAPARRGQNLRLASELDGSGLDVALAWLGFLVRSGQETRAHAVTDRLLAEVG